MKVFKQSLERRTALFSIEIAMQLKISMSILVLMFIEVVIVINKRQKNNLLFALTCIEGY
ncbi:hypothetical protein KJB68_04620 [Mammaliicoccus sciuri]|uniref:hypothetical protein n=1 Tax=Mammaliicoccus sciuri TaxID=1296 RepID=UPI001F3C5308|nr:hypothetical protein [Mammaliicoccus sciuri]MCE5057442.1 hypothetical protein [Mammaliicoccus sciuri]